MSKTRVKRAIATFALERLEEAERKADALDKLERAINEVLTGNSGWLMLADDPKEPPGTLLAILPGQPLVEAVEAMEEP